MIDLSTPKPANACRWRGISPTGREFLVMAVTRAEALDRFRGADEEVIEGTVELDPRDAYAVELEERNTRDRATIDRLRGVLRVGLGALRTVHRALGEVMKALDVLEDELARREDQGA